MRHRRRGTRSGRDEFGEVVSFCPGVRAILWVCRRSMLRAKSSVLRSIRNPGAAVTVVRWLLVDWPGFKDLLIACYSLQH